MLKTDKTAPTHLKQEFLKKDWKVVLFFGERFSLGKKVQVIELPTSTSKFSAFLTEPLLSVDIIKDEFSMFNTGPCRYIGFNALHYAGQTLPMAFSSDVPILNAPLNLKVVSLSANNAHLFNTTVFVTKILKLKDTLYRIYTETDDYFVTVEKE